MFNTMPLLVPVRAIVCPICCVTPAAVLDAAAAAILEAGAVAVPLIVEQTSPTTFALLAGPQWYHAAARARELDPRQGEKVLAFVASPEQAAALRAQLALMRIA